MTNSNLRLAYFGAALDTANLGVTALGLATLSALECRLPGACTTLFDFGYGLRKSESRPKVQYCGAFNTRRIYRSESLVNIRVCAWFGGLWNAGARSILSSDAILDISGGDSFTDMYGPSRFLSVALPKLIAIEQRRPLILLPQTYGPFQDARTTKTAQRIVRASSMAWARDLRSFEVLQELLGNSFDPKRHRSGVDVAFGLPVARPSEVVIAEMAESFEDTRSPLVGLNVSGLLLNRPAEAKEQYRLKADYRAVIVSFIRRLLRDSDARILLVPHVVTPPGHYESDIGACESIVRELGTETAKRVVVSPVAHDPCEAKWLIAQCDWFCGTRMHSTIAALSSGVPSAAISYSPKTLGVFETCALGTHVADPRQLSTDEVVEQLYQSWMERESSREGLRAALPWVLQQAEAQMDEVVRACVSASPMRLSRVH